MKQIFLLLAIAFFCNNINAQQKINIADASKHIGDSVTICSKCYGGVYLPKSKFAPTFINLGAAYPNQQLTIVIWGNLRKKINFKPEEKWKGKNICVTGKIVLYNNKPEIIINDVQQVSESN